MHSNTSNIHANILTTFVYQVLKSFALDNFQANITAEILVWNDLIARHSHGVLQLPILTKRLSSGAINKQAKPTFEEKSPTLQLLNGDAGMGQYVSYLAMEKAIMTAQIQGIGITGVYNSNHNGTSAYYINMAAHHNMLGLAMSNSLPHVAPYGGLKPVFGTNPLAFGAPRPNKKHILFDMATSIMAGSTARKCHEEGIAMQEAVGITQEGRPTNDPNKMHALLPTGGAKGYGLALMVEILCGILTGAGFSHQVNSMYQCLDKTGNNGHFFMAIDIKRLMTMENYYERLETLIHTIKNSGQRNIEQPVRLPGEVRWENYENNLKQGITLDKTTIKGLREVAKTTKVDDACFASDD